jgi:putative sugar O-methyltransferase
MLGSTENAYTIPEDMSLLQLMLDDTRKQPPIYRFSKYWHAKAKNAAKEIEKHGLSDFRGSSNSVGVSFGDCMYCDARHLLSSGARKPFQFLFTKVFPFKNIFDAQVALTTRYAEDAIRLRGYLDSTHPYWTRILSQYKIPYSVAGGCRDWFELNGQKISNRYMTLMDTIDCIHKVVDFSKVRSFFEIGGGYGVNVHLLIENFPNIKKIVYLDIPPNLYVGTQYLKTFYGNKVKDYRATRDLSEIRFADNDELEIICIASWQIEKLKTPIDVFHNAHSFVEMTPEIVKNYAKLIENLPNGKNTTITMATYDCGDLTTTIPPDDLKTFFNKKFQTSIQNLYPKEQWKNYIFIGR